ncbi:MAG: ABC transporter substrate-binding protein [Anaerolineales bacterium]|nr:ABC transporter substrate-binding protein [Anaerolineales bacterium]
MYLKKSFLALALGLVILASACTLTTASPEPAQQTSDAPALENPTAAPATAAPTLPPAPSPTPEPLRLTICLGSEPASLFPYTAAGRAAQTILALLYDRSFGSGEHLNNQIPEILEQQPTLDNGGMRLEPVTVNPGDPIVDSTGALGTLSEGTLYRPAGCTQRSCELAYAGSAPIQMSRWVLVYTLKPGLAWSDGAPLSAGDSLYGYQAARALFPAVQGDLLSRTAAYTALDERTLEWRGLPGYQDGDAAGKFFLPLPAHAWADIPLLELPASELASRQPLSWGAYRLSQWLPGESLTLERNPLYSLAVEALPVYDRIEVRFVSKTNGSGPELLAEGCDMVDPFVGELPAGVQVRREPASWTLLLFGVSPAEASRPSPFASQAVRQAAANCVDRAAAAQARILPRRRLYPPTIPPPRQPC